MSASTGCMLGWYDANGYTGTNGLEDMESTLGTHFALTRVYNQWWPDHAGTIATATSDGRLVLSSHKPPKVANAWVAVANGTYDSDITAMVNFYKSLAPAEVIFIFNHEPHTNASDAANKSPIYGTQADFVRAFRRIAAAFRTAGATNVRIGYTAVANFWACRGTPVGADDKSYPGDDVVDVLCHDDYNFFTGDKPGNWDSMQTVMENTVALAKRLNKPLIWGELGCQRPTAGENRDTWFRDGAAWLKTGDAATYTLGFCYYHVDNHNNSGHYWRFAQGVYAPQGKQGYIDGFVGDSHFLTKPIPASLQKAQPAAGGGGTPVPATQVASGGGIPSHVGFGMATVTMAGPITVAGAGAIPSPADYVDPEESPGLDFGTATVSFGELPHYGGVFEPPTADVVPAVLPETVGVQRRLFRYYGANPRGQSVVFVDGHYVLMPNPYADNLVGEEGVYWFLGGHRYVVDDDIAALLVGDGFLSSFTYTDWGDLTDRTWADLADDTWQEF